MDMMKKYLRSSLFLFLAPALVYLFIWRIVPVFYTVYLSFTEWNLLKANAPSWIGLDNYIYILSDGRFFNSLKITILFLILATAVEVIAGMGIAVLLDRKIRGIEVIKGLYLIPMLITPVVVGTIWYIIFHSKIGPLNYLLMVVGISPVKWLDSPTTALYSIIIADAWQWTPFVVLLVLAALQTVSVELYEAAKMDGASTTQLFRFITLPSIKRVLLIVAIIRGMDAFRIFDTVFIMTGGGPASATEVASMLVYRTAFQFFKLGYASAMVIILLCVISAFTWIYVRTLRI